MALAIGLAERGVRRVRVIEARTPAREEQTMITVEFTEDEAHALVDFLWGEESDREALRAANDKLMAAVDSNAWTASAGA
jgi:hypothetical protein